jgi:hypothetical protein
MSITATVLGLLIKVAQPVLQLVMKRFQQPRVFLKVELVKSYTEEEFERLASKQILRPASKENEHYLFYEFKITMRNNSDYEAYNIHDVTDFSAAMPLISSMQLDSNRMEFLQPLLKHEQHVLFVRVSYKMEGTSEEAHKELHNYHFTGPYRIEYANIYGREYYTEFHTYKHITKQNSFGSVFSSR